MNHIKYATNPLAENKESISELARFLFNPTKAEIEQSQNRRAEATARIREALARRKSA